MATQDGVVASAHPHIQKPESAQSLDHRDRGLVSDLSHLLTYFDPHLLFDLRTDTFTILLRAQGIVANRLDGQPLNTFNE